MPMWFKRVFLAGAMLALVAGGPAEAQVPDRIDVLIGFDRTPGAAEASLVRGLGGAVKYSYHLVPAIAANIPANAAAALLRSPRVTSVGLDGEVHAIDAELDNTWGVQHIGAGIIHAGGNLGAGVNVAVIDSGIDYTHSELSGAYVGGHDFVNNDADPMDDNSHGTHVSGTIAAADDGSGVVGMAPGASLYGLKVLDASGSGSWSDIIAALQWAVDNGIQVTNNSYGSSGNPGGTVQAAFDNAYNTYGILHIAAAGNAGNCGGNGNNVGYPAQYSSVVAVAATNSSDTRACFSSTGPTVELAAPGVSIKSSVPGGGYAVWNGTSMASPHATGAAALIIASDSTLTNADVRQRLVDTAMDLGVAGRDDHYGYGLVDVAAAAAGPAPGPDPIDLSPTVAITAPLDGDPVAGASVPVSADAGDDFGVTQVEFFADGGSIGIDNNAADGWSVTWDTTALCNGAHNVSATATDTIGQSAVDSIGVDVVNDPDFCAVPDPAPGALSVDSINPGGMNAANSPTNVTVTGSGFQSGAVLTFEGGKGSAPTAANVVVSPDGTSLTASVSAKAKGKGGTNDFDVVVTNPDLSTARLPGAFALTR